MLCLLSYLCIPIYNPWQNIVPAWLSRDWSIWLKNSSILLNQLVLLLVIMAAPSLPLHTPPSDGDRNRGWVMMVIVIIFNTIGTILVLARLYLRSHIKKNLGLDDLFIVLGLVKAANSFSDIYMAKQHRTDL